MKIPRFYEALSKNRSLSLMEIPSTGKKQGKYFLTRTTLQDLLQQ